MTREEAIAILIRERDEGPFISTEYREQINEALNMAIKALGRKPCEDAISRQAVHEAIVRWAGSMSVLIALPTRETIPLLDSIHKLPPVKPQEPQESISHQKMGCEGCKYEETGNNITYPCSHCGRCYTDKYKAESEEE